MASTKTLHKPPLENNLLSPPVLGALFSIYIIWGVTNLGNRFALESYPPFMLVALRLFLATLILIGFLKIRGVSFPPMSQMLSAMLIGGLMFGGRSGFIAFAQHQGIGTGMLALGLATIPLWAMVFAFILGYRPGKLELVGLAVGIFGIVILNIGNDMQSQPFAIVLLLLAPMTWAFGSMYSIHLTLPDGFMATAFQMLGGCVVLFVMSFLQGEQFPPDPTMRATAALIVLSVFGTLVAFSAYMYLVQTVSPGLATSYAYVNPVVAVIFSVIFLGESFPPTGIVAMVVIGIGVILVMVGKSQIVKQKNIA